MTGLTYLQDYEMKSDLCQSELEMKSEPLCFNQDKTVSTSFSCVSFASFEYWPQEYLPYKHQPSCPLSPSISCVPREYHAVDPPSLLNSYSRLSEVSLAGLSSFSFNPLDPTPPLSIFHYLFLSALSLLLKTLDLSFGSL